jgi:Tfp pilus assembly protein PilO
MSYAIRNTLILLVTLLLIWGGGFAYYKFFIQNHLSDLEQQLETKRSDLNSKQDINNQFEALNERYEMALEIIAEYNKTLYPANKPDDIYDFINEINEEGGNQISFDFIYQDSIPDQQYGVIQSSVTGFGNYAALTDFINRIENSQLLNKITELTISPARVDDDINDVNFSFALESYYQKTSLFDSLTADYSINLKSDVSTYNPLYPLIQSTVPPNLEGLVNVEDARLIGITANRVFLNYQGSIISLKVGDRVYLGYLSSLNIENKSATFNLNKGGIQEVVTLEVER